MIDLVKDVARRVTTVRGIQLVVRLTPAGIEFRFPRQRRTSALLLPYGIGMTRAAILKADLAHASKPRPRRRKKL